CLVICTTLYIFFFFFQAEDGIRDDLVTGVQTCALPICKPLKVLTGSTNWTITGLCTQANNGLIIDDPAVAQDFLDAWDRIHAAGNGYPSSLAAANSTAKTFAVDGCKVTPWFVPTQNAEDLDYARKLINGAKD